MTKRALPTNWPEKVAQAAKSGAQDFGTILNLLIKHDPEGLKGRGLDATARQAFYAQKIERISRAA